MKTISYSESFLTIFVTQLNTHTDASLMITLMKTKSGAISSYKRVCMFYKVISQNLLDFLNVSKIISVRKLLV